MVWSDFGMKCYGIKCKEYEVAMGWSARFATSYWDEVAGSRFFNFIKVKGWFKRNFALNESRGTLTKLSLYNSDSVVLYG